MRREITMNLQSTTSPSAAALSSKLPVKPLTLGLILAGAMTLAALGFFATGSHAADAVKAVTAKPALTVNLTQPKSSMLTIKLAANGSVAAWEESIIGTELNGVRLVKLLVQVGINKCLRG